MMPAWGAEGHGAAVFVWGVSSAPLVTSHVCPVPGTRC